MPKSSIKSILTALIRTLSWSWSRDRRKRPGPWGAPCPTTERSMSTCWKPRRPGINNNTQMYGEFTTCQVVLRFYMDHFVYSSQPGKISWTLHSGKYYYIPVLQMRKLKPKEVRWLAQGHTADTCRTQTQEACLQSPHSLPLPDSISHDLLPRKNKARRCLLTWVIRQQYLIEPISYTCAPAFTLSSQCEGYVPLPHCLSVLLEHPFWNCPA